MKYNKYSELINAMKRHVNSHVKHYKNDAIVDYETIKNDLSAKKNVTYIWVLRNCGTFLIPIKDNKDAARSEAAIEFYNSVRDCFPVKERREYTIQLDSNSAEKFTIIPRKAIA